MYKVSQIASNQKIEVACHGLESLEKTYNLISPCQDLFFISFDINLEKTMVFHFQSLLQWFLKRILKPSVSKHINNNFILSSVWHPWLALYETIVIKSVILLLTHVLAGGVKSENWKEINQKVGRWSGLKSGDDKTTTKWLLPKVRWDISYCHSCYHCFSTCLRQHCLPSSKRPSLFCLVKLSIQYFSTL